MAVTTRTILPRYTLLCFNGHGHCNARSRILAESADFKIIPYNILIFFTC